MKSNVTEAEVEQFARYNASRAKARGATPMPFSFHLSGARTHFAMGGTMPPAAAEFGKAIAEPVKAPPRPLPGRLAAVPPSPVLAAVVADRVRAAALIAITTKCGEAEAECREAIRTGASVEEYRATVAARSILDAVRASRGG